MTKRADNNVARSRNKIFALFLSRARSRWRSSRFFFFVPPNGEQGDADGAAWRGGSVRPTMIGGARSTKSPRDQAYIYFACFEGSAAGGYTERGRECERTAKRDAEGGRAGEDGRKEGLRNNAAYGACSSRATARDAVQLPAASSVGSRTKPRVPSYRVVVSLSSSSLFPSPVLSRLLHFARELLPL